MKIYAVYKYINDYPECGGGTFAEAFFLNRENAEKYAATQQKERNAQPKNRKRCLHTWFVKEWETKD